jgi:dynein heavy chain
VELGFKKIIDCVLVSAMGVPGGGKEFVTPRFLGHFNTVATTDLDDESMSTIFNTILT